PNNQPVTFTLTKTTTVSLNTTAAVTANASGSFTATSSGSLPVSPGTYTLTASQGGAVTASTPFVIALTTVTPATGGSAISADTAADASSPSFTTLNGLVFKEGAPAQIGLGTIVIKAPSGFTFNTSASVTATVAGATAGSCSTNPLTLASATSVASATTFAFSASTASSGSDTCQITFNNIQVQPTSKLLPDSGLATQTNRTGNLTLDSSSTATIQGVTPGITLLGNLTEIPGVATSFSVSGISTPITAGTSSTVQAIALDQGGNRATAYVGKSTFASTDTAAVLPATYTYTSGDAGSHTFTGGVTLKTAGTQTVTVADADFPSITGSQAGILVQADVVSISTSSFTVSRTQVPANGGVTVATLTALVTDQFGNPKTGQSVVFSSSRGGTDTISATSSSGGTYTATISS
ncbi:MAG: Ig-like domain-containing protein, partial [Chloroflexota bacterium]